MLKNMIITKLNGGLGNQLFQYAIAKTISIKNDTDLKLDITSFTNSKRIFLLDKFILDFKIASPDEIKKLTKYNKKYSFLWLTNALKTTSNKIYRQEHADNYFHFDPNILIANKNQDVYMDGYWQNEKYFFEIKDILKNELKLKSEYDIKNTPIHQAITSCESVSLHIRRTDYLTKNIYYQLTLDYYKKAIKQLSQKIIRPHFFIFSDDINWAKQNLKINLPTTYVDHSVNLKDYQEFISMSLCKHNIIANSSFSWWGAWLNNNPQKTVIAPTKWFNNKYNTNELCPKEWIKI